ncbi:MAG: hypothetical protein N3I35_03885 [Clostridia bacterium]|nr:hypothetical protein [Clostridia bacterium]
MENEDVNNDEIEKDSRGSEVVYSSEKDFYKGISGELRYKAEGLFKKAKEKGISIENVNIEMLKESQAEFPGIGAVSLPAFLVTVKGRHLQSGQLMVDGKQIDYFNIYQKYVADKIEKKNWARDDTGRVIKQNNRPKIKSETELVLTEWERFEIGKNVVDDKEFGIEKTITGACDRVIRKLMGENDWLYPGEARLLDEEFKSVQEKIASDKESRKNNAASEAYGGAAQKKATDRQINYLKSRIKNSGVDPDNDAVMREILKQSGFDDTNINDLTTTDMSKIIDSVNIVVPKIKETLTRVNTVNNLGQNDQIRTGNTVKQ